jgi:cytochrome c-type biogenesis protein CcmE
VKDSSADIDGLSATFILTDQNNNISVRYDGALPDLFREGQGIIAEGKFNGDIFVADIVLAKHDETYMPREVADSLKQKGLWQGDGPADGASQ